MVSNLIPETHQRSNLTHLSQFQKPFGFRKSGKDESHQSAFGDNSLSKSRHRISKESHHGSLGLNSIYTPPNGYKADIIFIHGLGGASRKTWSKNGDPDLFWPLKFLPQEPDFKFTRILTFGYNADFSAAGKVIISILDFAKELLFDLKHAKDEDKEELKMGQVPLIFVAHSMGGLVFKEAYMQGQHDPEYGSIIRAISAIIFLATPHRGTDLAKSLDRILRSTVASRSKPYVSELEKNSFTLQRLNEQFRHVASRLEIVSFYETKSTSIAFKRLRLMILDRESSVLGYPGETSRALDADHHNVCKYSSPRDPNYTSVRNALSSLIHKIALESKTNKPTPSSRKDSQTLRILLAITDLPDIDYIFFRDQWVEGTNQWLLDEGSYLEWLQSEDLAPSVLWLCGGPATGKSVISSFVINSLEEQGYACQYFFIRFSDQKKRTLSFLLRSLAYQVALRVPEFLQKVLQHADEAIDFENADPRVIWERIYKSALFKVQNEQPLYWIIDGLDEADDPVALIRLLHDISSSSISIRVLLIGREIPEATVVFKKISKSIRSNIITIEGHLEDFQYYIRKELSMPVSDELKEGVVTRIVEGARNNFLWVRLAVEKLNLCHTQADVELALQQLPPGMKALYDRMASAIAQNSSATDEVLVSSILQAVTCSLRGLTLTELAHALHEDVPEMLNIQRSTVDLCCGFVVVDNGGNVAMIHHTAREYLLNTCDSSYHVNLVDAHSQTFLSCMRCLMASNLRSKIKCGHRPTFFDYAATSWSSHLKSISPDCGEVLKVLQRYLRGSWVLTWIQALAMDGQLRMLSQASRDLSEYCAKLKTQSAEPHEAGHNISKLELIESWAEDLLKINGKFGRILRRNPEAIYKLIPPFCPQNSAIYRQFGRTKDKSLVVSGLSTGDWDDSLARIIFRMDTAASSVLAAGTQIAILFSLGSVFLYESSLFEEAAASPIEHGERVSRMILNRSGTLLVTYGYLTTKVWETATGNCRISVKNIESRPLPLAMVLTDDASTLVVGTDDRWIRSLDLTQDSSTWQVLAKLEEPELEGHFLNAASHIALSKDGKMVTVAYRGHPLSAWEIDGPAHIGHCWRKRKQIARGEVIEAVWHPYLPEVFGLYIEGAVFRWCPYEDETDELSAGASRLAISRDGNLLATGDVRGTVKVYTTTELGLLYQMTSEDTVFGMAFSPDSTRFYDIRWQYANAWEPNALVRYAEQTDKTLKIEGIENTTQVSTTLGNLSSRVDSITVLAGSPIGRLYCYGTQGGTVRLYDIQGGKLADVYISQSLLSTEQMSWSNDGRFLCFSDSSRKVSIKSISPNACSGHALIETKAELSMTKSIQGPILHLLFHPDSSQVLVISSSTICTISLISSSIKGSLEMRTARYKWIVHPRDPALIMGIAPTSIHVLDWDLARRWTYHLDYLDYDGEPASLQGPSDQKVVDRVLVTQDKNHVFVQSSALNQKAKEKTFLYFETTTCSSFKISTDSSPGTEDEKSSTSIIPVILPPNLSSNIALALSFLADDKLIFLSRDFSICSWRLPFHLDVSLLASLSAPYAEGSATASANSTPHMESLQRNNTDHSADNIFKSLFPLPGDWINRDSLAISTVWGTERSLLYPRNGDVAVVRCADLI